MMRRLAVLFLLSACSLRAQEAAFSAAAPYPVQRYEAGWGKNPFTLKTAPVLMENAPFATDLAIGTYYGDAADPTIVLVNTKTNERIRLKKGQPAPNGMKLDKVQFGSGRKDIAATVTLGAETSEIRYNDSYLKQVASAEGARTPVAGQPPQSSPQQLTPQQAPSPRKIPLPQLPVQPAAPPPVGARAGVNPASGGMPAVAAAPPVAPALPQMGLSAPAVTSADSAGNALTAPSVTLSTQPSTSAGNLTVSVGLPAPSSAPAAPAGAQTNAGTVAELPQRRRFITPVVNATATP